MKVPKVNLVTVVGDFHKNHTLVQMIKHYLPMVDSIYINFYYTDNSSILLEEYLFQNGIDLEKHNIFIINLAGKKYDWDRVTDFYNDTTALGKENEWWIISDCDELQYWPVSPKEVAWECDQKGYTFVTGGFLDRIGKNGTFPTINSQSDLDVEFPLIGFFRYPMSGACPNKVVMVKTGQQVCSGQHYAIFPDGSSSWGTKHRLRYPVEDCFVQVHHFKWDSTIVERLKETYESGCSFCKEYEKMYNSILDNRINVENKRFYIENYSPELGYDSYRHWNRVKNIVISI